MLLEVVPGVGVCCEEGTDVEGLALGGSEGVLVESDDGCGICCCC